MIFVDTVILNLVERACRRFQRLTGRTNVWLALQLTNLSIVVYFLWAGASFWSAESGLRLFVGLFCAGVLYVLMQTLFKEPIETYENNAFRRVQKGMKNPRRVRDVLLRISFLMLSAALLAAMVFAYSRPAILAELKIPLQAPILTSSLIVLTTAVLYLLACDPLPPAAEEVRERARTPVPAHEL